MTLSSQADVDAYPVDQGCTTLTGTLRIDGSDIIDLTPLAGLTAVDDLEIEGTALVTLAGLDDLATIVFDLVLYDNGDLVSLAGLGSLTSVGEDVEIEDNGDLEALTGLDIITSVGGDFLLSGGDIVTLAPLAALESVGGDLRIEDIDITSLTGLGSLVTVLGDFLIRSNYDLTSLAGLTSLTTVGGTLDLSYNDSLTSLVGLEGIMALDGLAVQSNPALTSLAGLSGLTMLGDLEIQDTPLTDLTDLAGLSPTGEVHLIGNAALTSLAGLEGVRIVEELSVRENPLLTSLTGLDNLVAIDDLNLVIWDNAGLESLEGLEKLSVIGNQLSIRDNPELTTLDGLQSLTAVNYVHGGSSPALTITGNAKLRACASGLSGLIENTVFVGIGGTIDIGSNGTGCASPSDVRIHAFSMPSEGHPFEGETGTTPAASPVDVGAGGTVRYTATIANIPPGVVGDAPASARGSASRAGSSGGASATSEDIAVWPAIRFPDGTLVAKRRALAVRLETGESVTFNGRITIPDSFPDGTYTFFGYAGEPYEHPGAGFIVVAFDLVKASGRGRAPTRSAATIHDFDDFVTFGLAAGDVAAASPDGASVQVPEGSPGETVLGSGYPNPFNPTATIPFTLAAAGDVRLTVYDLLGREVAVLAEGRMEAGRHTAVFDASVLASGTYLVRLTAADGPAHTQRLTLLK